MKKTFISIAFLCATGCAQAKDAAAELKALGAEVALMQQEVTRLEAENEIENLQRIFGFYFDKNQWTQAADLFTADATLEWGGSGVY